MDQIEFPDAMPQDVREQIWGEACDIINRRKFEIHQLPLKRTLISDICVIKIDHYNRIKDANDSANATIKVYQDRVDELTRQVDTLKMKIR